METVGCNLCEGRSAKPAYQLTDLLLERLDTQVILVKCDTCGLVYQNPRPTMEEIGAYYPPEYESYQPLSGQKKLPWLLGKAYQYGTDKRCRIVTRLQQNGGRLLDVGCATGNFLMGMKRLPNWELYGVEPNEHAARVAQENGLNVFVGVLEQARYPDNFFDAVTLWDVLEHLHDPKTSLKEIFRILKPGGLLVVRVPNLDSWDAGIFRRAWAGLDAPRHLYVFDRRTLSQILEQAGLRVKYLRSEIGSYPTFVLSVRFWLVQTGVHEGVRQAILHVLLHSIARILFAPFFYVYSLNSRGPLVTASAIKG